MMQVTMPPFSKSIALYSLETSMEDLAEVAVGRFRTKGCKWVLRSLSTPKSALSGTVWAAHLSHHSGKGCSAPIQTHHPTYQKGSAHGQWDCTIEKFAQPGNMLQRFLSVLSG